MYGREINKTAKNLIAYVQAWKDKFSEYDMMFTGCEPFLDGMRSYAKNHDLKLANSGCCSKDDIAVCKESGFSAIKLEQWLVDTNPEIIKPVLEKVQKHFNGKFYILFDPLYIDMHDDGYEQHSYVFAQPENASWIEDIIYRVAFGKIMQILHKQYHGVSKQMLIRYDWQYTEAMPKFEHKTSSWFINHKIKDDTVNISQYNILYEQVKSAIINSLWLKNYFTMFSECSNMLNFKFKEYENDSCNGTMNMQSGGILYTCECSETEFRTLFPEVDDFTLADLDNRVKKICEISRDTGNTKFAEEFEKFTRVIQVST